jgi:hypothetical protein
MLDGTDGTASEGCGGNVVLKKRDQDLYAVEIGEEDPWGLESAGGLQGLIILQKLDDAFCLLKLRLGPDEKLYLILRARYSLFNEFERSGEELASLVSGCKGVLLSQPRISFRSIFTS